MAMGWTEDLSVGVDVIDQQHKIWFEKANQLFDAGKNGKAKEFIAQMLDFLDEYTKMHFRDEENAYRGAGKAERRIRQVRRKYRRDYQRQSNGDRLADSAHRHTGQKNRPIRKEP